MKNKDIFDTFPAVLAMICLFAFTVGVVGTIAVGLYFLLKIVGLAG